uniref:Tryptophanyl-tRNA synthetase n=1 Tax=Oryza glumipatula TaxID=40148 RepID=A0A0D9Y881_9ORYZ
MAADPPCKEVEQVVTPWEVSAPEGGGTIDYEKMVDRFSCNRLDVALVDHITRLTSRPPHHFLRRGIFFAHRCSSAAKLEELATELRMVFVCWIGI